MLLYACHNHKLSSSATCNANVSVLAMLEWFVSRSDVDHAMNEGTLLNDNIECRPEKLPCTCVDKNVNILRIRKYFTDASWNGVLKAIEQRKGMKYYCQVCERDLEQQEEGLLCICCDGCLQWMHLSCTSLKAAPKKRSGFASCAKIKALTQNQQ